MIDNVGVFNNVPRPPALAKFAESNGPNGRKNPAHYVAESTSACEASPARDDEKPGTLRGRKYQRRGGWGGKPGVAKSRAHYVDESSLVTPETE